MTTTTKKIRAFYGLLKSMNLMHQKEEILGSYNVASTKDLTGDQLDDLIRRLNVEAQRTNVSPEPKRADSQTRYWRSVNIDLLTRLGVHINGNWKRVNEYLLNPKIAGKELYVLNVPELKALSIKLRMIQTKRQEQLSREDFYAKNN